MQLDTPFRQLNRKRRRVRTLFLATLNRFVRNEPSVAAATQIASSSVPPAGDVTFVLIRNSDGKPIQLDATGLREVKNVFMAIIQKSFGTDRLEMTIRANRSVSIFDGDRFDPMNRVLQNE